MNNLGVNLAGVEVILRMMQHMTDLQHRMNKLESELERLSYMRLTLFDWERC